MKIFSSVIALLLIASTSTFNIMVRTNAPLTRTTSFKLFRGKKYSGKKGPEMMDHLTMFKRSQEVAHDTEKELSKTKTIGLDEDRRVKKTSNMCPLHYLKHESNI